MKIPTKKYRKLMIINICVFTIIFVLKALIWKEKFEFDTFIILNIGCITPYLILCDKEKIHKHKK